MKAINYAALALVLLAAPAAGSRPPNQHWGWESAWAVVKKQDRRDG